MRKIVMVLCVIFMSLFVKAQTIYVDSMAGGNHEHEENIMKCRTKGLLISIDIIGENIIYKSWTNGKGFKQQPDIIIYDGAVEHYGNMGGETWTFNNNGWTYEIMNITLCDIPAGCGIFYNLYKNDILQKRLRMKLVK